MRLFLWVSQLNYTFRGVTRMISVNLHLSGGFCFDHEICKRPLLLTF